MKPYLGINPDNIYNSIAKIQLDPHVFHSIPSHPISSLPLRSLLKRNYQTLNTMELVKQITFHGL